MKDKKIICTTRSHASHDVNACIEAMKPDEILRQGTVTLRSIEIMEKNQNKENSLSLGGAGNKVLRVIEGDAHAYVFASPGTKKWDTCAPEAVLVAMGGALTGSLHIYKPNQNM